MSNGTAPTPPSFQPAQWADPGLVSYANFLSNQWHRRDGDIYSQSAAAGTLNAQAHNSPRTVRPAGVGGD